MPESYRTLTRALLGSSTKDRALLRHLTKRCVAWLPGPHVGWHGWPLYVFGFDGQGGAEFIERSPVGVALVCYDWEPPGV